MKVGGNGWSTSWEKLGRESIFRALPVERRFVS